MSNQSICLHCGKQTKPGQYLCKSCQKVYRDSHKRSGVETTSPGVHRMELTR